MNKYVYEYVYADVYLSVHVQFCVLRALVLLMSPYLFMHFRPGSVDSHTDAAAHAVQEEASKGATPGD